MGSHTLIWTLRIAHFILFGALGGFVYGLHKINLFQNPNSPWYRPAIWVTLLTAIVGVIAHRLAAIQTRVGYYLGLHPYPRYRLY